MRLLRQPSRNAAALMGMRLNANRSWRWWRMLRTAPSVGLGGRWRGWLRIGPISICVAARATPLCSSDRGPRASGRSSWPNGSLELGGVHSQSSRVRSPYGATTPIASRSSHRAVPGFAESERHVEVNASSCICGRRVGKRSGAAMAQAAAVVAGRRMQDRSADWVAQVIATTSQEGPLARLGNARIGPRGWTAGFLCEVLARSRRRRHRCERGACDAVAGGAGWAGGDAPPEDAELRIANVVHA